MPAVAAGCGAATIAPTPLQLVRPGPELEVGARDGATNPVAALGRLPRAAFTARRDRRLAGQPNALAEDARVARPALDDRALSLLAGGASGPTPPMPCRGHAAGATTIRRKEHT